MSHIHSFSPLARPDATRLILGSMPGKASLAAQQYYAHPRNAFWRVMAALLRWPPSLPYESRCGELLQQHIAVWDVLKTCTRTSSLDSDIDPASIVINDFSGFFAQHPRIECIYFNGGTAARIWRRHVLDTLPPALRTLATLQLPSTSPAHAALAFEAKLQQWAVVMDRAGIDGTAAPLEALS